MLDRGSNCALALAVDGAAVSLAHANQLPLPRLQSTPEHVFTLYQVPDLYLFKTQQD